MDLDFIDFLPYTTCLPEAMQTFHWTAECFDGCYVQELSDKVKFSNGVVGRMNFRDSCVEYENGVDDSLVVDFDILDFQGFDDENVICTPFFGHMRVSVLDMDSNVVGVVSSPEQSDVMKLPERLDDYTFRTPTFRASDEVIEKAKIFHTADRTHWFLRLRATIWLYDAGEVMGV